MVKKQNKKKTESSLERTTEKNNRKKPFGAAVVPKLKKSLEFTVRQRSEDYILFKKIEKLISAVMLITLLSIQCINTAVWI